MGICRKHYFLALNLISSRLSYSGSLSASEVEKKRRLACDKFDIFVAHTGLVYDATDTNCQARNGSTHSCGFATFKTLFFNTQEKKQ